MKTKIMVSAILVIMLMLSVLVAIPSAAAIQCCPRAVWTKDARNNADNYLLCILNQIFILLTGNGANASTLQALWRATVEGADDFAWAHGIPVTSGLLHTLGVYSLEGPPANLPPAVAASILAAAEAACGWPPSPTPGTYIEISQKDYCFDPPLKVGSYFNVTVVVQNVTDMMGAAIKLGYNSSVISAVRVYPTYATANTTDWLPVDSHGTFHFDADPTINNTRYYMYQNVPAAYVNYSYLWVNAWGFNQAGHGWTGDIPVFKVLFQVVTAPPPPGYVSSPENVCVCCALDLFETLVLDSTATPIPAPALDGTYCDIQPQILVGTPQAICSITPATQYVGNNVTFDGSASTNGTGGHAGLTYMWDVGSDGVFDIITTKTTASWRCDSAGIKNVTLTVVNLLGKNDTAQMQTWECIKPLGTIQDLYTSPTRFCGQQTPYIGTGLANTTDYWQWLAGVPGAGNPNKNPGFVDALTPDVNLTLYTKITYNGDPRMHVLVAYQIIYEYQEVDQSKGFPAGYTALNQTIDVRTAETDKNGIAVTWFRVPMWCTGLPFGKWLVVATCKVQEVKQMDWIRFDVGYPVWLISAKTYDPVTKAEKTKFAKYDTIGITITAKNIMFIDKPVLFTATVYDVCSVPIATTFFNMTAPKSLIYDTPMYFSLNVTLVVPQWTYVGLANIYVDAYVNWPSKLGEAYCPEVSTGISITS